MHPSIGILRDVPARGGGSFQKLGVKANAGIDIFCNSAFRGYVSVGAVGSIAPMVFKKSHIDAQHLVAAGCAEIWVLKQSEHSYFCNFAAPGI